MKWVARSSQANSNRHYGQAMVEFALAATALFLVIAAIMFMSEVILGKNTLCSAARLAARYASVHGSTISNASAIQAVAIGAAPDLKLTTSDVVVTFPADTKVPSHLDAKIVISYSYSVHIPFMSAITFPLTVTSQMPVSQ